mmetsp:Transcript_151372/g.275426  ORF Transcript_151372/g.275426 Transcript_151372/m.275426 type:complete len:170 (+) Transcript_151372:69-578(+)
MKTHFALVLACLAGASHAQRVQTSVAATEQHRIDKVKSLVTLLLAYNAGIGLRAPLEQMPPSAKVVRGPHRLLASDAAQAELDDSFFDGEGLGKRQPDGGRGSVNVDDKLKELMRAYIEAWSDENFDTSDKLREELFKAGVGPTVLNARYRKQIGAPESGPFKKGDYVK